MAPYQVVRPCQEAGTACLQEENQRDLQVARIQEADLVEEQAYLLAEVRVMNHNLYSLRSFLPGGKLGMPGGGANPGGRPCGRGGMPTKRQCSTS
jgi:hypothetical protein